MKKTLIAVMLSLALVFTFGTASSVFAEEGDAAEATQYNAANSYLVKYLQMEKGVTNPGETFAFSFTKTAGPDNITLDNATITPADASRSTADGSSVVGSVTIASIIGNHFDGAAAGIYSYTVKEVVGDTNPVTTTNEDGSTQSMKYSTEEYQLNVYVKNNEETGKTEVEGITVAKVSGEEQTKVDPSNDDPTTGEDGQPGGDDDATTTTEAVGGFSFTNTFTKTVVNNNNPDPENPDDATFGALGIKKLVEGAYADKTKGFKFNLTLQAPATFVGDTTTEFDYILKGTAAKLTFDENGAWTAENLTLADTQSISFTELPAGTTYTVEENLAGSTDIENNDKYFATIQQTTETGNITGIGSAESLGNNIKVAGGLVSDSTNGNLNAITNTLDDNEVTPTGIIINNLPYIILILLAIGGIAIFARKRRYQ